MTGRPNTTTWPELAAILLARLGCLWLLVLVSFLLPHDDAAYYALMGVAFIITIPYSLWLRNRLRSSQFAQLQFMVDLLLVTGLVYFTGGIRSDLTLLYPLVILSAGIVGTPKQAAEITVLGIVTYVLMATLLRNDILVEYVPAEAMLENSSAGAALFLRSATFALFGAASVFLAKRCHFADTREKEVAEATAALLGAIPAAALLLDSDGQILFATEAAEGLVGAESGTLVGQNFRALAAETDQTLPERYGDTHYLARDGKAPLPVAYSSTDFRLPSAALPDPPGREPGKNSVTLVLLSDISGALESARQLEQMERVNSATRIAGELAHEIRTPLTALSASVQLLRRYEEKATAADWLPNSPRRIDRNELFEHIEDSTRRLDSVIKNFIDFAEFSPADLMSIIKLDSIEENKGYIGHLNTTGRTLRDGQNTHSGRRSDNSQLA